MNTFRKLWYRWTIYNRKCSYCDNYALVRVKVFGNEKLVFFGCTDHAWKTGDDARKVMSWS